jgi:predicted membrane protein
LTGSGNPIEGLAIAKAMREELWLYPAVEIVHIIGFSILVGSVVMFDLRVLGLSRQISVRALARHLLPWSVAALLIIVPTGLLMFSAHAGDLLGNRAFQLKMALLLTAGMNAAIFHTSPFQSASTWDTHATAPLGARISVALSLVLWFSIIGCGRLLAYL